MKRKNMTRNALVTSILALLLCVSMLVGTTFAWFTDSVESLNNVITAGNLDIEVTNENGDISGQKKLFQDVNLWEPGVVAYENLNIANVGTLALKYALYINFANENYVIEADGTETSYGLASALKVAVVDTDDLDTTSRETLIGSVTKWTGLENLSDGGELLPAKTENISIVIYWEPSDSDNNWNVQNGKTTTDGDPLHIDLGIKVLATQLTYESDSFDHLYDEDAKHAIDPAAVVKTIDANGVPTYLIDDILNGFAGENVTLNLDTAYSFKGESPETAAQNQYADWFVDFYVSLDNAPKEGLILSGQYGSWDPDNWYAFYIPTGTDDEGNALIEPNTFYPLLGTVTNGGVSNWTYTEICEGVGTFNCGALDKNFLNEGTTMTVQLRLINPENPDETIAVREVKHTFANSANSADELKALLAAGKNATLATDIVVDVAETGFVVAKGASAKIDLNGHDIIATSTSAANTQLFSVSGNLEIVGNGTISLNNDNFAWNTSARYTAINIRETGVVTLGEGVKVVCEGGSATADGYGMTYAVDIYTTGTLNVNGASLHSNYIAVRCFFGNSVVNVGSGSSITSSKNNYGIWPQSAPGAVITIDPSVTYTVASNGIYIFG